MSNPNAFPTPAQDAEAQPVQGPLTARQTVETMYADSQQPGANKFEHLFDPNFQAAQDALPEGTLMEVADAHKKSTDPIPSKQPYTPTYIAPPTDEQIARANKTLGVDLNQWEKYYPEEVWNNRNNK
jgi:hypothetical protein